MCGPLDRSFKIAMIFRPGAPTEGSKCRVAKPENRFSRYGFLGIGPAALAKVAGSLTASGAMARRAAGWESGLRMSTRISAHRISFHPQR
jgi:hypothetical protein